MTWEQLYEDAVAAVSRQEVTYCLDTVDVQTPSCYISGHQDVNLLILETSGTARRRTSLLLLLLFLQTTFT